MLPSARSLPAAVSAQKSASTAWNSLAGAPRPVIAGLAVLLALSPPPTLAAQNDGSQPVRTLVVSPVREGDVALDGRLDEAAWRDAAGSLGEVVQIRIAD